MLSSGFEPLWTTVRRLLGRKIEAGRIVFLNKTCEQQLNLKLDECYGKTDFDFWPAEIAKRLQEGIDQKVLESGLPLRIFEETASAEREHTNWMTILLPFTKIAWDGSRSAG